MKQENRKDVREFLAKEIAESLTKSGLFNDKIKDSILFTNVPRRQRAIVEYGYDHAALLTKEVASILGCEYRSLLVSESKRAQKSLSHEERKSAPKMKYKATAKSLDLSERVVIIIDDIVTTGSSMAVTASYIRALGCRKIYGASISIAYADGTYTVATWRTKPMSESFAFIIKMFTAQSSMLPSLPI